MENLTELHITVRTTGYQIVIIFHPGLVRVLLLRAGPRPGHLRRGPPRRGARLPPHLGPHGRGRGGPGGSGGLARGGGEGQDRVEYCHNAQIMNK